MWGTETRVLHAQIQGIEEVSAISVIGTIGMAWALSVIAVKLCVTPRVANYAHTQLFPQLRSFGDVPELLVAVFDTVFTFGGQVNWLRYLMSMQQKRKFPLAVANVSVVMEGAAMGPYAPCRPPDAIPVSNTRTWLGFLSRSKFRVNSGMLICLAVTLLQCAM